MGFASGSAYLFDVTTGEELMKLFASEAIGGEVFGYQVALHGNLALMATSENAGTGAVYVFDVETGQELAKLERPNGEANDAFGSALGIHGRIAVVGARSTNSIYLNDGAAYLFDAPSGQLLSQLDPTGLAQQDAFGTGVGINARGVVVTAPGHTVTWPNDGASWTFEIDSVLETGAAFCFGDGTGSTCPCGSNGGPGEGCANSTGISGATLMAIGDASVSHGTFELVASGVPGSKPGLILRGANALNGGLGTPAGDGLLCTGGQSARSHVPGHPGRFDDLRRLRGPVLWRHELRRRSDDALSVLVPRPSKRLFGWRL